MKCPSTATEVAEVDRIDARNAFAEGDDELHGAGVRCGGTERGDQHRLGRKPRQLLAVVPYDKAEVAGVDHCVVVEIALTPISSGAIVSYDEAEIAVVYRAVQISVAGYGGLNDNAIRRTTIFPTEAIATVEGRFVQRSTSKMIIAASVGIA